MSVHASIEKKLNTNLSPDFLEVDNESHMHNVPPDSETHFKVVIVSREFEGKMLVARHRIVNHVLKDELDGEVHALALHTMTPGEWEAKKGKVKASPPCHGGSASQ